MRRPARLAVLAAGLVVLPATAALAHPSLNPNAIPVGEPVESVLVIPHGCSAGDGVVPDEGEGVATTRVDLQVVDGVTVHPDEVDGWDVTDDDEAVVWTDAGGATTDPIEFPVTVTVTDVAPGDTLMLSVFQECEDGSNYRWTPGSEDTPAVRLEVTEGEVSSSSDDHGSSDDPEADDDASDQGHEAEAHGDDSETDGAHDDAEADQGHGDDAGHEVSTAGEDLAAQAGAQALAGEPANAGVNAGVWIAIAAVVMLLLSGLVAVVRGRKAT